MPLTNCEVSLILTWSRECAITSMEKKEQQRIHEEILLQQMQHFKQHTKFYVPVANLSTKDDNNSFEQLKSESKRTIKWNKYTSEMTNQTKTNNFNYLIDLTFNKVNRLLVLSFENEEGRTSFSKYYTPKVEIKDFNVLIDGKSFLMCQ